MQHIPVLLDEVLNVFADANLEIFVDGTLGAGGHAAKILETHPEIKEYIGFDQDKSALNLAQKNLEPWKNKLTFVNDNFVHIPKYLKKRGIKQADGILLDLGVSSMQLDQAERGFSFSKNGPLDMRMDPRNPTTAAEIVNFWSERDLMIIFKKYGEEPKSKAAAKAIVQARQQKSITTTQELVDVLKPLFPWQKKGINPLTLIFQALRIAVNKELDVLEQYLPEAIACLAPKGLLAVISFHSLEDRIVKETFRYAASDKESTSGIGGVFLTKTPQVRIITRKPIISSEQDPNPRARSAKMRVVEKI